MISIWLGLSSDNVKISQDAYLHFDFAFSVCFYVQMANTYFNLKGRNAIKHKAFYRLDNIEQ